jgi:membrane protease YdiL (CAAX protease family)
MANALGRSPAFFSAPLALPFTLLSSACATQLQSARLDESEPVMAREKSAEGAVSTHDCDHLYLRLLPGVPQLCLEQQSEGSTMLSLGVAELTTGVAVAIDKNITNPGAALPLVAASDLLLYSATEFRLEQQRAQHLAFVPQDTFSELLSAPFNIDALSSPDVWMGIVGTVGLGLVASYILERSTFQSIGPGQNPNLFGLTVPSAAGYPIGAAIGVGTFDQVALAEETFFRGDLQSSLSRGLGETPGWLLASGLFGAAHAPNALLMSSGQRLPYLAIGVPFISLLGSYLGLTYRWHDYSLVAPVAVHFWYDFTVSAIEFFLQPQHSPLSASIKLPF